MKEYMGVLTIVLLIALVIIRNVSLKNQGIKAVEFGQKDKKDFILLPFAFFYFYLITANAFNLPTVPGQELFYKEIVAGIGVLACMAGLLFFLWALISFKKSFRVGLVENTSQGLITTGVFTFSRNPIYVSFAIILIGQFFIFPSWILFIYIVAGVLTFHRQVLKEEIFLRKQYGNEFETYCREVRRYV